MPAATVKAARWCTDQWLAGGASGSNSNYIDKFYVTESCEVIQALCGVISDSGYGAWDSWRGPSDDAKTFDTWTEKDGTDVVTVEVEETYYGFFSLTVINETQQNSAMWLWNDQSPESAEERAAREAAAAASLNATAEAQNEDARQDAEDRGWVLVNYREFPGAGLIYIYKDKRGDNHEVLILDTNAERGDQPPPTSNETPVDPDGNPI